MLIQFQHTTGIEIVMSVCKAERTQSGRVILYDMVREHVEDVPAGPEAEHAWAQVKSRWASEECRSQVKDIEWHWKQLIEALAGIEGRLPR